MQPRPSSSGLGMKTIRKYMDIKHQCEMSDARKNAEKMIRDAELSRAEVLKPAGKNHFSESDDSDDEFFTLPHILNQL